MKSSCPARVENRFWSLTRLVWLLSIPTLILSCKRKRNSVFLFGAVFDRRGVANHKVKILPKPVHHKRHLISSEFEMSIPIWQFHVRSNQWTVRFILHRAIGDTSIDIINIDIDVKRQSGCHSRSTLTQQGKFVIIWTIGSGFGSPSSHWKD